MIFAAADRVVDSKDGSSEVDYPKRRKGVRDGKGRRETINSPFSVASGIPAYWI